MRTPTLGARAFIPVALAGAFIFTLAPSLASPAAAAQPKPKTEAQQIISIARKQLGDPWRYAATGPRAFDCSGLVIYSFRKAGDARAVAHGKLRSARALYHWYAKRGLASRSNPKPGDLVIWGRGTHVGIYVGNGKAISTLTSGVRVHGVHAVRARFTAYLHTGMWKKSTDGTTAATRTAASTKATTAATSTSHKAVRHTRVAANLRTGPSIARHRIATLRDGARLVVLRTARDGHGRTWLKVQTGSRVGWVASWLTTRH